MKMKTIAPALGLVWLLSPALAWANGGSEGYSHGYGMMGGWGWGMLFGPVMMIVAVAVVITLVVLIFRWIAGSSTAPGVSQSGPVTSSALDVLKERFVRGEIEKDEFEEKRRILGE